MNAMSKVAPELTDEGLAAVVEALPPAATVPEPARALIYLAIEACSDAQGDKTYLAFEWAYTPFGDPSGTTEDEDEEARWNDWRDAALTQRQHAEPWNYLLGEAERLAPDFNRWSLPGARLRIVGEAGSPAAPLQVWSFDDDDDETPDLAWVVADLIQAQSLCVMVGAPEEGKTTLALALALHIAAGAPFAGREVLQGAVVYVAAEGHPGGLKARVRVMRAEYGVEGALPLRALDAAKAGLSLLKPADVDSLIAQITALASGQPVRAVILDTLPQLMSGQDENSAHIMGLAVASMGRIRDTFSSAVIALTHPARGGSAPRGSSALTGAVDTQFAVTATKRQKLITSITLDMTKQRNAVSADPIVFDTEPGLAALVPVHRQGASSTPAPAAPKPKLSAKAKLALAWLVKHGAATEDAWRIGIAGQLTGSVEGKAQRQAFYRVRDELKAAGAVILGDDGQWRAAV